MIIQTKDKNYIKEKIEEKMELFEYDLARLIIATNDFEYIKSFIENQSNECYSIIPLLLLETHNSVYIREILENKEEVTRLKLNERGFDYKITELILATNDMNFVKKIINDEKKREYLRLNAKELVDLMLATNDIDFIKEIIRNKEKIEQLGLTEDNLNQIKIEINDTEYVNEFLQKIENYQINKNDTCISLPSNMTIGIEIESEGINSQLIEVIGRKFLPARLGM